MSFTSWVKQLFGKNTLRKFLEEHQQWDEKIADDLRKLNKRHRRQAHFLESMQQELNSKLDATYKKVTAPVPYEPISDFALNFSLFCLSQDAANPTVKQLWAKFSLMLEELDMELVLDLHGPFDDSKHRSCDVRFDPDYPEGTILEVVRPGLLIQGRLHTQAVVVVNKEIPHEAPTLCSVSQ